MEKKLFLHFNQQFLQLLLEDEAGELNTKSIPYDLKRPFSMEELKDQIRSVLPSAQLHGISWFGGDFTLIPDTIFLEAELQTYYELNFGKVPSDYSIQFEKIHFIQAVLVYSVPNWVMDIATHTLHMQHVHSVIGNLLQKQFSSSENDSVFVLIEQETFVLAVKQQNKLKLCLPTEFHGTTDILYFILANQQHMRLTNVNALHVFMNSTHFNQEEFETLWKQFKDFNEFETQFYSQAAYQKSILCASSVVS